MRPPIIVQTSKITYFLYYPANPGCFPTTSTFLSTTKLNLPLVENFKHSYNQQICPPPPLVDYPIPNLSIISSQWVKKPGFPANSYSCEENALFINPMHIPNEIVYYSFYSNTVDNLLKLVSHLPRFLLNTSCALRNSLQRYRKMREVNHVKLMNCGRETLLPVVNCSLKPVLITRRLATLQPRQVNCS